MMDQATEQHVPTFDLADRLKKSLRESDLSVQDIAEKLDVTRSTVSLWLNGHSRPRRLYVREWARLTGVWDEWLWTGDDWPDKTVDRRQPAPKSRRRVKPKGRRTAGSGAGRDFLLTA